MRERHSSPYQQKMIAMINQPFQPHLNVMDWVEAFVDEGPATATRTRGDVLWAGSDRTAIDSVRGALLKHLGSNKSR